MAALWLHPAFAQRLRQVGLDSFARLFEFGGDEIIGGHRDRNVSRFRLAEWSGYLKREYRIPWKDYLASWWAGFGWACKSWREWSALQALRNADLGCPEPLAVGCQRGQALLLVRELAGAVDLTSFLLDGFADDVASRRQLAETLGRTIARLHSAGFTHPDLYAKHVLIRLSDQAVFFIDLQRTRRRRRVGWRDRCRDLASLHASVPAWLIPRHHRLACIRAYLQHSSVAADRPFLRRILRRIDRRTRRLRRRSKIIRMNQPPRPDSDFAQVESFRVTVDLVEDESIAVVGNRYAEGSGRS